LNDREMRDCLLLVFANKQDLPGAMSPQEVTDQLGLAKMKDRVWYVHPSNALAGDGLFEGGFRLPLNGKADVLDKGLAWLSSNIKNSAAK
jgi:ADP-ribosylation factor protein 6